MYSVVLMMAMTAAPETPNWGHHWSCHGCWGSCYGCWGGCYGGCWGSCYGSWGWGRSYYSCYGCYGCYGYYSSCCGCCGGYAVPYSCYGYGIYGGASYTWPYPYVTGPTVYGYQTPAAPVQTVPKAEEKLGEPKKISTSPDQARVRVILPADAKLYANGQMTNLASGERWFNTPVIEKGRDFQYTMKVEYVRNGATVTDSQVVKVRAGEVSLVEFAEKSAVVADETATSVIKVIAPPAAKLFVEENQELPAGAKEFTTPKLPKGKEFAYNFRAELTKDGKKQSDTRRVVFKAGEPVTVDFSDLDSLRTASK